MKFQVYHIAVIALSLTFFACGPDNSGSVREDARQSLNVENRSVAAPMGGATATPTSPTTPQPPVTTNNSGVNHYICSNNCEGSGGPSQVACPVCGNMYVHNAAYHNQPTQTQTQTQVQPQQQITPPTPEPAQNAAGVWHYTCPSGCEGGAGSAVACASCGSTLAHNSAYHN